MNFYIASSFTIPAGSLKVMLLCGSDLLESFSVPGVWIPDQVYFEANASLLYINKNEKYTL